MINLKYYLGILNFMINLKYYLGIPNSTKIVNFAIWEKYYLWKAYFVKGVDNLISPVVLLLGIDAG